MNQTFVLILAGVIAAPVIALGFYSIWGRERHWKSWRQSLEPIMGTIHECPACRAPESQLHATLDVSRPYIDLACLLCGHRWAVSTRK